MKNIFRFLILFIAATSIITSCQPESEDEIGPDSTDPKQRFIARWNCTENSLRDGGTTTYEIHINDSTGSLVNIENFYGLGFNKKVIGNIYGDSLIIQTPQVVSGLIITKGRGKLQSSGNLSLFYIVDDGNPQTDSCYSTCVKL